MDHELPLRAYDTPHEAELAAMFLRSRGVSVRVDDGYIVGANPLWGLALGGVRLHVPISEAERASELLSRYEARHVRELGFADEELNLSDLAGPGNDDDDDGDGASSPATERGYRDPLSRRGAQREPAAQVRRALVAGVVGLFVCPVLGSLYSLWLAVRIDPSPLGRASRRQRSLVLLLGGVTLLFWGVGLALSLAEPGD